MVDNGKTVVVVDNSILATKERALKKLDELRTILTNTLDKFNKSDEYFDSESGDYFRELAKKYIDSQITYLDSNVVKYVNSLDEIDRIYSSLASSIGKGVGNNE